MTKNSLVKNEDEKKDIGQQSARERRVPSVEERPENLGILWILFLLIGGICNAIQRDLALSSSSCFSILRRRWIISGSCCVPSH